MTGDEGGGIDPAARIFTIAGSDERRDELAHLEMQMRPIFSAARADSRDLLAALHPLARRDERYASAGEFSRDLTRALRKSSPGPGGGWRDWPGQLAGAETGCQNLANIGGDEGGGQAGERDDAGDAADDDEALQGHDKGKADPEQLAEVVVAGGQVTGFVTPKAGSLTGWIEREARELLRAGVAALNGMSDKAFLSALNAVPSLKTGRPAGTKTAATATRRAK